MYYSFCDYCFWELRCFLFMIILIFVASQLNSNLLHICMILVPIQFYQILYNFLLLVSIIIFYHVRHNSISYFKQYIGSRPLISMLMWMQGLAKDFIANEVVNWNNRGNEKKGKVRGCFFIFFYSLSISFVCIYNI